MHGEPVAEVEHPVPEIIGMSGYVDIVGRRKNSGRCSVAARCKALRFHKRKIRRMENIIGTGFKTDYVAGSKKNGFVCKADVCSEWIVRRQCFAET